MTDSFEDYLQLTESNIKNHISELTIRLDNYLPQKLLLGLENDFEFIRGWMMGQIQASCLNLYRESFAKNPTQREYHEIAQLLSTYNNNIQKIIREYVRSN